MVMKISICLKKSSRKIEKTDFFMSPRRCNSPCFHFLEGTPLCCFNQFLICRRSVCALIAAAFFQLGAFIRRGGKGSAGFIAVSSIASCRGGSLAARNRNGKGATDCIGSFPAEALRTAMSYFLIY